MRCFGSDYRHASHTPGLHLWGSKQASIHDYDLQAKSRAPYRARLPIILPDAGNTCRIIIAMAITDELAYSLFQFQENASTG
jgi:hypothetical protein